MQARFWIRKADAKHLMEKLCRNFPNLPETRLFSANYGGILEGVAKDKNEIFARYDTSFVLGEVKAWDAVRDPRCLYVAIQPHALHQSGAILTRYSGTDVRFHRHKKTIDKKWDVERFELIDGENLIEQAVKTFYEIALMGRGKTGYDPRFMLFDTARELDDAGNISDLLQYNPAELNRKHPTPAHPFKS